MSTVTIEDLQKDPGSLLDRVTAGETILVMRNGIAAAEFRAVSPARTKPRPYGLAAGEFSVPDDFDSPLPDDVIQSFEGE